MPLEIVFSARGEHDLAEIDNLLASYRLTASDSLTAAIKSRCARLAEFPQAGRSRPEIGTGLRSFAVPGRATVLYRTTAQTLRVMRVLDGGRNVQTMKAKEISV